MKKQIIKTGGYSGIGPGLSEILPEQGQKSGLKVRNVDSKTELQKIT